MVENVTFWYLPDDEKELLEFIEKDHQVVALPLENAAPVSEDAVCTLSQAIAQNDPPRVFLVLKSHLSEVEYVKYEKDSKTLFGIDAVNSPVILFSRSVFRRKNQLGQASVSANLEKLTADKKTLVAKPDEFLGWVKGMMAYVRKKTPKWHEYKSYRITERVFNAMDDGLELVF